MTKCEKCGTEYDEETTTHKCAETPAAQPAASGSGQAAAAAAETVQHCPECEAEFSGKAVKTDSKKIKAEADKLSALQVEFEAYKKSHPDPPAAPAASAGSREKRRGLFRERRARKVSRAA